MSNISSISISGINAAQTRLQASAQNIANLNIPDSRQQDAVQSAQAQGGTSARIVTTDNTIANVETDMVQQLQARNSFLVNLSVFRTSDQMMGSLLDTLA